MRQPTPVTSPNFWIVALILAAIAIGVFALFRMKPRDDLSSQAEYPIEQLRKIDPVLIRFDQTLEFSTGLGASHALAVGPKDRIHVVGDLSIRRFESDGTPLDPIDLDIPASCLAIGDEHHAFPGRYYIGSTDCIVLLDERGKKVNQWKSPFEPSLYTAIALAENDIFVADAKHAVVLRYDTSGKLLGQIGRPDSERGIPQLIIPSPFFDIAVSRDELLWIVNPGALRLQAHSFDGNLELFWGESGGKIEGFFGCCNPAHIGILSDGRFVTAEKGLLRVKIYSEAGVLESVVAGPEQLDLPADQKRLSRFDHEHKAVDVAVDSNDRIVVLDLQSNRVRMYEPKQTHQEKDTSDDT